ncbi:MAG: sugar transferase [Lachnospiraceae bacterium]|nr:sugar transferase [Lachnospiraceae bacterium]
MRKRYKRYLVAAIIGVIIGGSTYLMTKRKQNKAKRLGNHVPYGPYEAVIKRPLDVVLSGTALIVLSPILAVTGLLVRIKLGSPILFRQERPGLHEKVFTLLKFRTMTDKRNTEGELLSDEERMTAFGRKLRSFSVDELPELMNILKGDMAIIGPRPLLVEYLPRYSEEQHHRHDVRPGLTGLAQVRGRNSLTWEEKFRDDVEYVNHITFFTDMKIILDTVKIVLKRSGISSATSSTMERFMGSEEDV